MTKKSECPICLAEMDDHFSAEVLFKYSVLYYKCPDCGLIQTETPYWLEEAYGSAITDLDVGLVQRNIHFSEKVSRVLDHHFDPNGNYLDFAGGYGLFVRLMRDRGYNFYRHDKYCQNIFAQFFDVPALSGLEQCYELITAFEVLEHIVNPFEELERLLKISNTVLFSTELLPVNNVTVDEWWYFVPECGQHITFYTRESLLILASRLDVKYQTIDGALHILTRRENDDFTKCFSTAQTPIKKMLSLFFDKRLFPEKTKKRNKKISTSVDYEYIKRQLKSGSKSII